MQGQGYRRYTWAPACACKTTGERFWRELSPLQAAAGDAWGRSRHHHVSHSHFHWAEWGMGTWAPRICYRTQHSCTSLGCLLQRQAVGAISTTINPAGIAILWLGQLPIFRKKYFYVFIEVCKCCGEVWYHWYPLDEQMVFLLCFFTAVTDGESSCLRKALFGKCYLLGAGMRKAAWMSGPCNLHPRAQDHWHDHCKHPQQPGQS